MSLARIIRDNDHDTSTLSGIKEGGLVNQIMGDSSGYAEYKRQYELAEDKTKFNAEWFSRGNE